MWTTHQDYFLREFGAEGYWTDLSSSSRTALMDVDHHVWSKKIMDLFGFDMSQHPKLAEGGTGGRQGSKACGREDGIAGGDAAVRGSS